MTRVYVSRETREVVGARQAGEVIERKCRELMQDEDCIESYLYEHYTMAQVWKMTDEQKRQTMEDFHNHSREEAEVWFDEEFCEYQIE